MDEGRIEAKNAPSAGTADSQIPMYEEGRSSFCPERRLQPDELSKTRMKSKKWNLILIGFIVFFSAITLPVLGLATTYYVATNGNNLYNGLYPSYQGGSNGPFRTLGKAANTVHAGDTVQIRTGTYREASTWSTDGTQANRITITNYNGETVIIDGKNFTIPTSEGGVLLIISGDWYTVSNLNIHHSHGYGLVVSTGADHCTLKNIYVYQNWWGGISFSGSYGLANNCRAYNNSLINENYQHPSMWSTGISACRHPDHTTIRGCTAWDNWGEGISTYEATYTTIEDNVSYNNQQNYYISDTKYCLFQRNLSYSTPGNMIQDYDTQNGILIGDEKFNPASSNNTIINNLVLGGERNIAIGEMDNCLIANNTFVNASDSAGTDSCNVLFYSGKYTNARFMNNVILQENSVVICVLAANGVSFGNNNWSRLPVSGAQGTGDITGDPILAKTGPKGPGLLTPAYFKILANSPARNQARVLSQVKEDFFRTPRGSAPDMGGHEFSYGTSPLTASATGSPTSGQAPLTVSFTGSATGGTSPYSYRWTFGDGGSSTSQNPSHTYSSVGSYTATLTVTDSQSATNSKSLTITATSAPSHHVATASALPTSGQAPLTVNFTGSATGSAPRCSYSWNFGDGGTSSTQNPSYTYSAVGTYTATLTVTDSVSANATATININVTTMTSANLSLAAQTGAPAPGQGGTTDPLPGIHSFSIGSAVQAKSIPNPDYRFSKWEGDVSPSSTFNSELSVTMDNNKSISSTFCTKCTDINGDLRITPADAQLAFDIYLNRISNPTWCELENADVNASGTKQSPNVTPSDAQTIFNKYLKKGDVNITCSGNSRSSAASMQNPALPTVQLAISNSAFYQSEDLYIPIILESPSEIGAFGFDLLFPSNQLTYIGLERTELTNDFDQLDANVIPYPMDESTPAQANMVNTSVLRVGGYKTKPTASPSSGVLITLIFRASGEIKEWGSISIIATYDDIQNASITDGTLMPRTSRAERPAKQSAPSKRLSGKKYDF